MRVLHINNSSHTGGAARAMRRLHIALKNKGHDSYILVGRSNQLEKENIRLIWNEIDQFRSLTNSVKSRIGNNFEKFLGIHPWANRPGFWLSDTDIYHWADIVELRNLFGGFFNLWSLPAITRGKPVVWRLPDLWAVTGHCSFPYDCERWKTGCYQCPLLTQEGRKRVEPPPTVLDGTRRVWHEKRRIYESSLLHIVVNSKWMRNQISESILKDVLSVNIISNGVELDIFKPMDKEHARAELGLPAEGKILLYVAHRLGAYRKGFHLASKALLRIQENNPECPMLITMGSKERLNDSTRLLNTHHFGYVEDPRKQALIYSAADVFLCTTLAEGQPQTILESMACGTPVIAFNTGPMPEEVSDGENGFLVEDLASIALAGSIRNFLDNEDLHPILGVNCRQQALEKYDLKNQTDKYINLYERILNEHPIGAF